MLDVYGDSLRLNHLKNQSLTQEPSVRASLHDLELESLNIRWPFIYTCSSSFHGPLKLSAAGRIRARTSQRRIPGNGREDATRGPSRHQVRIVEVLRPITFRWVGYPVAW